MNSSENSTDILRKFVILYMFEKGQILRKNRICLKNCFDQTSKRGQILTKTLFLPKVSHIQLYFDFLLFWSIFGEIHRELLFFVQKLNSTDILRKFVILNMFEKGQNLRKIWICLNKCFWSNKYKVTNVKKIFYSPKWATYS